MLVWVVIFIYADITIPPHSLNVSLNEVAEFNCTAFANTFLWIANNQSIVINNGIEISPVIPVDEAINLRMSKLRVPVSAIDNATNITCSAVILDPLTIDESEPALLLVQGTCLLAMSIEPTVIILKLISFYRPIRVSQ